MKLNPARIVLSVVLAAVGVGLLTGQSCVSPSTPAPEPVTPAPTPRVTACGLVGNSCEVAAGNSPDSIVAGDFDNDGDKDLAVGNFGGDSISILINKGSGKFSAGTTLGAGDSPSSLVAADFNHDGRIDLAVASVATVDGPGVSVFINQGGGSFAQGVSFTTGQVGRMLASGDLDRNGSIDLITVDTDNNTLSLLPGGGDGVFGLPVTVIAGGRPKSVAVGDLDRDGSLDLAVANELNSTLTVHRNNGLASFLLPLAYQAGSLPQSIAAADLNGDGHLDLVTANRGTTSDASDTLSLFINNRDGTFRSGGTLVVGANPVFVVAADLNDDGQVDLAVANIGTTAEDSGVAVLLNQGNASFPTVSLFAAGDGPSALAVSDLDGDGDPDLAVADFIGNRVILLGNDGTGFFSKAE